MNGSKALKPDSFDTRFFADAHPAVQAALDQKLSEFEIKLELVPTPMYDEHRRISMLTMHKAFLRKFLELKLKRNQINFSHDLNDGVEKQFQAREPRTSWFRMLYTEPGNEFRLAVADAVLSIKLQGLPLRTVVTLAANVFEPLLKSISAAQDLSAAIGARERLTKIEFSFYSKFRLGKHKDEDRKDLVKNHQILLRALGQGSRLDGETVQKRSEGIAYRMLGIETDDHIRVDFNLHALKSIHDTRYVIKVISEAPFNEHNSILYIRSLVAADEEFFSLDRSLEAETPFIDFYKDIIVKQFLYNLLCSTQFTAID